MAQKKTLKESVRQKAVSYLRLLEKNGVKVEKAFVFGSYAKGSPKPWSDIDICLISKQFGKDIFQEGVKLSLLAEKIDLLIEPHPFHPADFAEKYNSLAEEIKKYGFAV
ncbi:MAG: nucleotidyltransferase domain-containing protein [bacterium]|nr:nucleotidyltransferase domain-containing protein [bacterium]